MASARSYPLQTAVALCKLTRMDRELKFDCPACNRSLTVYRNYLQTLMTSSFLCPHCGKELRVKISLEVATDPTDLGLPRVSDTPVIRPRQTKPKDLDEEMDTELASDGKTYCPHCHDEVGERDKVCISCGGRIHPQTPD